MTGRKRRKGWSLGAFPLWRLGRFGVLVTTLMSIYAHWHAVQDLTHLVSPLPHGYVPLSSTS